MDAPISELWIEGFIKAANDAGITDPVDIERLLRTAQYSDVAHQFPEKYAEGYDEVMEKDAIVGDYLNSLRMGFTGRGAAPQAARQQRVQQQAKNYAEGSPIGNMFRNIWAPGAAWRSRQLNKNTAAPARQAVANLSGPAPTPGAGGLSGTPAAPAAGAASPEFGSPQWRMAQTKDNWKMYQDRVLNNNQAVGKSWYRRPSSF